MRSVMAPTMTATQVVQSLYEAFGRGDVPCICSDIAPDGEWIVPRLHEG